MKKLVIQRVQKDAAPEVLNICKGAAIWLNEKGIDQWQSFSDPEKARATIDKRFDEGEVFLAYLDGVAVGTITLQWNDEFWGPLGNDASSGYIHTMTVRRDFSGHGLGRELLDWAGDYFKKSGKIKMRLDCMENNSRLCRYYDEQGFKTIGHKDWNGKPVVMKERGF